ncbi:hypothetical protein Nepgr_001438 [Nepenthes gracilis]|uniref:Uncharacterized protein n=1 Tax=Nepenthes gracilis TaxID=150966 RepID=A0AAD3RX09_NEPGR|nr:hypothetical protein Nepgr_001438 [Nepenthes gracilis]
MRIRTSATNSVSACSSSSSSSCLCSSNSTISNLSLASSSNSSSSYFPKSSNSSSVRCEGIDLLIKAVYYVAGSAVGVPYIQRRVIRRRKRALTFSHLMVCELFKTAKGEEEDKEQEKRKINSEDNDDSKLKKRRRRAMALPIRYQDSVLLHPWKPISRG